MAKATLLFEIKRQFDDGHMFQARIWRVPNPVRGSSHTLKYSLYYGRKGSRLLGYDNEAGKGDHRHYGDHEEAYSFTSIDQLVSDFLTDLDALRGGDK